MTAAGLDRPPTQAAPTPALVLTAIAAVRVAWLYLISRRVPAATSLLTAISAMLWAGPAAQLKAAPSRRFARSDRRRRLLNDGPQLPTVVLLLIMRTTA